MVRVLLGGWLALTACYHPHPVPGAPCDTNAECPEPLICRPQTMTCEDPASPIDAPADGDELDAHLHAAPGWRIAVLADLTGVVPYKADDFTDGTTTMEVLDNAPNRVTTLYAPFTSAFAVAAGRSIIEVTAAGATMVHDYRPATPDMAGPDNLSALAFCAPADTGARLWVGAASLNGGDGLYSIDASWTLHRDAPLNNVTGVTFDPDGAFDALGAGVIYFIDQAGIERRDTATMRTVVSTASSDHSGLAITPTGIYSAFYPSTGGVKLVRIASGTHAVTDLATDSGSFDVAEGGPVTGSGVIAIRNEAELVVYADDGTGEVGASTTDPAWKWRGVTRPRTPHPLAGSLVFVESNRTLGRDRLLVVTPP